MTDPTSKPDFQGNARNETRATPRWVIVFAIIIIVLLLVFGIMHLTSGGLRNHTALGDHAPSGALGGPHTPSPGHR